ncbi:MAG TPA: cupin domain-containing protein [Pyrinomonadaceae bacterium]|nr:cupin domain-containing protein [Pyrinomonadaceae bacterium]
MTFGTTESKPWVETLPTPRAGFAGRTFSRFHIVNAGDEVPTVGEIWATSDHAVESHVHDADELLYVLSGAIAVDGRRLGSNEVVFIPRGSSYSAQVLTGGGARVLRIELPNAGGRDEGTEYEARAWRGPLTDDGVPQL